MHTIISLCNIVVFVSEMYVSYNEWVDYEMNTALKSGKFIIGVKTRGQEKILTKITNIADVMIGWNSISVVQALRGYSL